MCFNFKFVERFFSRSICFIRAFICPLVCFHLFWYFVTSSDSNVILLHIFFCWFWWCCCGSGRTHSSFFSFYLINLFLFCITRALFYKLTLLFFRNSMVTNSSSLIRTVLIAFLNSNSFWLILILIAHSNIHLFSISLSVEHLGWIMFCFCFNFLSAVTTNCQRQTR